MPEDVAPEALEALRRRYDAMPVETVEVRLGRSVAVHQRESPGSRDVAFLVHGSCASMTQWSGQVDTLLAGNFNVVAYDAYGCDRSPKPMGWAEYSSEELFMDLRSIVQRFGAPKGSRNILVAHSMGCSFSLRLAAEQQDLVHALVLLGALDAVPVAVGALFRLPVCLLDRMQPSLSADFKQKALTAATRGSGKSEDQELVAVSDAVNGLNPMHMCKAYYRQLVVPSPQQLAEVRQPVLLLHGEEDQLVLPLASKHVGELLTSSSRAQHKLIQGASHQLMQEQPEAVNAAIKAFVAETK